MADHKPVDVAIIGGGNRGWAFSQFALAYTDRMRVVAVAEPDPAKRARIAGPHQIEPGRQFADWRDLAASPQLAEAAYNSTVESLHYDSTMALLDSGYHVLLEKPIGMTARESAAIVRRAEEARRILMVCHVLRYSAFWKRMHDVVTDGRIGRVISLHHNENVRYWHMAHSFVRGVFNNTRGACPMLVAKSCHDLDLICWLTGQDRCVRVSSFGSLTHFVSGTRPDAPARCTDGCKHEPECPYSALKQYLGDQVAWPVSAISVDLSREARLEALKTGRWGRCVYRCDNDAVDHQVVQMEYASGATVAFTMVGFAGHGGRTIRVMGTGGDLRGFMEPGRIELTQPGRSSETLDLTAADGHGGGDSGLFKDFVAAVAGAGEIRTSGRASLESHLIGFAAEQSRLSGRMVDMEEFRRQQGI